jgi:hypothetical protein
MKLYASCAFACIVFSGVRGPTSNASEIQYAWAGTIISTGANDPWLIGPQGQPFSIAASVSSSSADLSSSDVQFATFNLDSAEMTVSGQKVGYIGNGIIDFTDNSNGMIDLVLIAGDFQRFGQTIEIESAVDLDPAAFAFTQISEPSPDFASTTNIDRITCCGGTYTLLVDTGTVVAVVPEPRSVTACALLLILSAAIWRTRHDRTTRFVACGILIPIYSRRTRSIPAPPQPALWRVAECEG